MIGSIRLYSVRIVDENDEDKQTLFFSSLIN